MIRDILARLQEAVELGLPIHLTRQEAADVAGEVRRLEAAAARRPQPTPRRRGPRSVREVEEPGRL